MTEIKTKLEETLNATLEKLYDVYVSWDVSKAMIESCKTKLNFMKDNPGFDLHTNEEEEFEIIADCENSIDNYGKIAAVLEPIVELLKKAIKEAEQYEEFLK